MSSSSNIQKYNDENCCLFVISGEINPSDLSELTIKKAKNKQEITTVRVIFDLTAVEKRLKKTLFLKIMSHLIGTYSNEYKLEVIVRKVNLDFEGEKEEYFGNLTEENKGTLERLEVDDMNNCLSQVIFSLLYRVITIKSL